MYGVRVQPGKEVVATVGKKMGLWLTNYPID